MRRLSRRCCTPHHAHARLLRVTAAATHQGGGRNSHAAPVCGYSIRPAQATDVQRLAAIERRCGELSAGWSASDIAAELDKEVSRTFVAADSGSSAPLGYLAAWLVAGELQVLELAVDPDHQSRGIGGALLAHALRACSAEHGAVLEVKAHNACAIRLYERHGFQAVGRRPGFYADGSDAVLMARPASSPSTATRASLAEGGG